MSKINKAITTLKRFLLSKKNPKFTKSVNQNHNTLNGLIAYNQYGGYFTPLSSQKRSAVQAILRGKAFEPDTISFMRNNCQKGDIVHAGTFFGDFLPALSSGLSEQGKIWAFEPNLENYRCAQITIQINDLKNVHLFNFGLGDKKTTTKMLVENKNGVSLGGGSKIIESNTTDGKTIEISINKIDDIVPIDRQVSIIQLDVEGYEKEALSGALLTIQRCKPILILEDNNNIINTSWFKENIFDLGYQEKGKIHANTLFTPIA